MDISQVTTMTANIRQEGHEILDQIPDELVSEVVQWLRVLAAIKDNPDVELEDMWLLASGELKKMADEAEQEAKPLDNWRKYLDEL